MHVHAYKHARLMDESEARVEMAVGFESEADRLVANRILASPDAYRRWEIEHDHLLRAISEQAQLYRQVVMLRSAACALVHRKALFEYLRDCQVRGRGGTDCLRSSTVPVTTLMPCSRSTAITCAAVRAICV